MDTVIDYRARIEAIHEEIELIKQRSIDRDRAMEDNRRAMEDNRRAMENETKLSHERFKDWEKKMEKVDKRLDRLEYFLYFQVFVMVGSFLITIGMKTFGG